MFTKRFATSTRCLSLNRMRESKAFRCTLPALREDRLNSLRCWAERACALLTAFRDSPGVVLVARSPALRKTTPKVCRERSQDKALVTCATCTGRPGMQTTVHCLSCMKAPPCGNFHASASASKRKSSTSLPKNRHWPHAWRHAGQSWGAHATSTHMFFLRRTMGENARSSSARAPKAATSEFRQPVPFPVLHRCQ